MGGRTSGSGNAAWRAARASSATKPGNVNRRLCKIVRDNGTRCKGIAVTGMTVCYQHGGIIAVIRRKQKRRKKLRYAAWTETQARSDHRA